MIHEDLPSISSMAQPSKHEPTNQLPNYSPSKV